MNKTLGISALIASLALTWLSGTSSRAAESPAMTATSPWHVRVERVLDSIGACGDPGCPDASLFPNAGRFATPAGVDAVDVVATVSFEYRSHLAGVRLSGELDGTDSCGQAVALTPRVYPFRSDVGATTGTATWVARNVPANGCVYTFILTITMPKVAHAWFDGGPHTISILDVWPAGSR
jgi:hypothetical protein